MKRKICFFVILLIILCLFCSDIAFSNQYDFRKVNWGMSKEEVENSEWWTNPITNKSYKQKPKYDLGNEICYYVNIIEMVGNLTYEFVENKLISSRYNFIEEFEDEEQYIINFYKIKEYLVKKYGKPKIIDPGEKSSPEEVLKDVKFLENVIGKSEEQYPCFAYWHLPKTEIRLVLIYERGNFHLVVGYYSRELMDWAEKIKEEKILEKF